VCEAQVVLRQVLYAPAGAGEVHIEAEHGARAATGEDKGLPRDEGGAVCWCLTAILSGRRVCLCTSLAGEERKQ
jgi:hypothetical protein